LPLKGAQGGLAIANGIFWGDFNFRGQTFPMIPEPRFGFGLGIHKACGISCLSATVDKAIEKFKLFIHVQRLMEASGTMWRGSSFFDKISISKDNEAARRRCRRRIWKYVEGADDEANKVIQRKQTGITISGSMRFSQQDIEKSALI
jgi:hypothetical protein